MRKKGKYLQEKNSSNHLMIGLVVILVLAIVSVSWLGRILAENASSADNKVPIQIYTEPTGNSAADYELPTIERPDPMQVSEGLEIEEISSYAGIYMEDGSDEIVSGVMMLVLKNTSEKDLQLAQIRVVYEGFSAEFEASNIPAGERVVLLEKNRAAMPAGEPQSVETDRVIFFQEPMSVYADMFEITGGNGYLDVKNISGEDITGWIRVFYKNSSQDLLYGGITYMTTLDDGIPAGETVRILTGHYSATGSRIIHVVYGE